MNDHTSSETLLPPHTDPLDEILHLLRLDGVLYCRADLTSPWGIELPELPGCMMIQIVGSGHCWLEVDDDEPLLLQQGSLALLPHGTGHTIRNGPEAVPAPLTAIPVERVTDRYEVMRHGGGGELTRITYCGVRFDHLAADRLIQLLPRVIHVETWDQEDSWLQSTVRFISREARQTRPGGETIITRLADIIVIQAIRAWIDDAPGSQRGWLTAVRDRSLGAALVALHREPARDWTVESLARVASMSRSGFSERFTDVVGQPVMQYLTHWRMRLARTRLVESSASISEIAESVGYRSEAAFSRAFKRAIGESPGRVRRAG